MNDEKTSNRDIVFACLQDSCERQGLGGMAASIDDFNNRHHDGHPLAPDDVLDYIDLFGEVADEIEKHVCVRMSTIREGLEEAGAPDCIVDVALHVLKKCGLITTIKNYVVYTGPGSPDRVLIAELDNPPEPVIQEYLEDLEAKPGIQEFVDKLNAESGIDGSLRKAATTMARVTIVGAILKEMQTCPRRGFMPNVCEERQELLLRLLATVKLAKVEDDVVHYVGP